MTNLEFPIFPLDSSAITVSATVWIGVLVSVFFNLRLGWTLTGLVVPGYLVPLIMTRPITAVVIFGEAVLTYLFVLALSKLPRQLPYWSSFFGRDRFFVILIASVLVRAVLDGFALPWIGSWAAEHFELNIDYRNNLHSFGLIIVALIANYFWKPGVIRGFPPLLVCVGFTYMIVRFVVGEFTNFNVGNFHAMYEDITTSLMSSPKSYIVLITTAYLASWINLRYAWEFNGILIPSLLGLLWHDPFKIMVSGVECLMLYLIGGYLMKAPVLRTLAIQGSRKIVFFFTICFLFRLCACHLLPQLLPGVQVTDAFGFGYLLTTLMAIKIHDKNHCLRMLRGTAEISVLGAVTGSLIGFAFYCGPPIDFGLDEAFTAPGSHAPMEAVRLDQPIHQLIRADKVLLYEKQRPESYQPPLPSELRTFAACLRQLEAVGAEFQSNRLDQIAQSLVAVNYELCVVRDRYVYLRERSPANGWGLFVIDTQHPGGICIEVPAPMDEWGTVEAGLVTFSELPSRALAIAGAPRRINFSAAADVSQQRQTMFRIFHSQFAQQDTMQIRGYTRSNVKTIAHAESLETADASQIPRRSRLYVQGSIPPTLELSTLKQLAGSIDIRWNHSPIVNRLRQDTDRCFAELFLSRSGRQQLFAEIADKYLQQNDHSVSLVDAPLSHWLRRVKERILMQGSDQYIPAKIEDMLYMDQEVVQPLLQLLATTSDIGNRLAEPRSNRPIWLTDQVIAKLIPIDASARAMGYRITVIKDVEFGESLIALSELDAETPKGWGTYVFRPGLADPFGIEIPRPLFERRSFDFGVNLFDRPRSSALLIAGAHPRANLDGSADISKAANRTNLFNLVRHVLLRHLGDRPFLLTQARAIQAPVDADIVAATDDGTGSVDQLTPLKSDLISQLQDDRLDVAFVTGQKQTAGYELGILMQAMAIQISQNKEVMSLWLSPSLRTRFREQSENNAAAAQFHACGIPTIEENLLSYLSKQHATRRGPLLGDEIPNPMMEQLSRYVRTGDVVLLYDLVKLNSDWQWTRLIDGASGQAFLLIQRDPARVPAVLSLTGAVNDRVMILDGMDKNIVTEFIRSRALWLIPSAAESADHRSLELTGPVAEGGAR